MIVEIEAIDLRVGDRKISDKDEVLVSSVALADDGLVQYEGTIVKGWGRGRTLMWQVQFTQPITVNR